MVKKGWNPPVDPPVYIAGPEAKLPASFLEVGKKYTCLCPLTVLLQAVASSLSDLEIESRKSAFQPHKPGPDMGHVHVLYSLLKRMEEALLIVNGTGQVCVGLATCIMFHEKNSRFTVHSSVPFCRYLTGLHQFARLTRFKYLGELQKDLPQAIIKRIKSAEDVSQAVFAAKGKTESGETMATLPGFEKLTIDGTNITVTPKGEYKEACLTDHLRLAITRPPAMQHREDIAILTERKAMPPKACAEWLMVSYLYASPDPAQPPVSAPPVAGKQKKAFSFEQHKKKESTLQPSRSTETLEQIPVLGTPRAGIECRAPSPEDVQATALKTRSRDASVKKSKVTAATGSRKTSNPKD